MILLDINFTYDDVIIPIFNDVVASQEFLAKISSGHTFQAFTPSKVKEIR